LPPSVSMLEMICPKVMITKRRYMDTQHQDEF
jgi:hypothetical protein